MPTEIAGIAPEPLGMILLMIPARIIGGNVMNGEIAGIATEIHGTTPTMTPVCITPPETIGTTATQQDSVSTLTDTVGTTTKKYFLGLKAY